MVDSDFERHYRKAMESGEPVGFDAYYPEPLDAWYEVRAWPNPDGLAVYFVDVTARHQAQEQVARTARRDALVADVDDPRDVGEHLGHDVEGERVVTHRFACTRKGYVGWHWCVTLVRAPRQKHVTVAETVGEDWLTPQLWRFGASSLLNDVLLQRQKLRTGHYSGPDYVTVN